ncbi:MAG: aspartate/glutamate racemase family protein [Anaerolineales bacterium]
MKTIGLIGGMSWESSAEYYRLINEGVKARLGGLHSAQSLMFSVDFAEIEALQMAGDWATATQQMIAAARRLEGGGADCVLLCTNTMHKMADAVAAAVDLPLLHIADATAEAIRAAGLSKIGLLGTRFTMEQDFYAGRLRDKFGLEVLIPPPSDQEMVHGIIYDELCLGVVENASREVYQRIIADLQAAGAEGVILGCTEITLLIKQDHSPLPVFDTTALHAGAAVDFALA